jgi:hypothetical protein
MWRLLPERVILSIQESTKPGAVPDVQAVDEQRHPLAVVRVPDTDVVKAASVTKGQRCPPG